MTGAYIGSEHWQLEQLKKGKSFVFVERKATSLQGTISRFFEHGTFEVNQCLIVKQQRLIPIRGVIVTRIK